MGPAESTSLKCLEITHPDHLEAIFRLRYAVYVEEMARRQQHADHGTRRMVEPLDEHAIHLAAFCSDRDCLIGALRINLSDRGGLANYEELYGLGPEAMTGRAMVITRLVTLPESRGGRSSAGLALAKAAYRISLRERAELAFIDCSSDLVPFFEWLGFDTIRCFEHPEYGDISVMRLDPLDRDRFAKSGSPLLEILDDWDARTR